MAIKQFVFATVALTITAFIPYIMSRWKNLRNMGVFYGIAGIFLLLTVFVPGLGYESYGSRNWIKLGWILHQQHVCN